MKMYVIYYEAPEDSDVGIIGISDAPMLLVNEVKEILNNFENDFSILNETDKNIVCESILDSFSYKYGRFNFYKEAVNVYLLKELAKDKNNKFRTTQAYELGRDLDIKIEEVLYGNEKDTDNECDFDIVAEINATQEAIEAAKKLFPDLAGGYGFDQVILTEDMITLK